LSEHSPDQQTKPAIASDAKAEGGGQAAPGKHTRVEQAHAGGSAGHKPLAPHSATGSGAPPRGPQTGLALFAPALARVHSPRQLERLVPASVLAQHGVPRSAPGKAGATAPTQRKASGGDGDTEHIHAAAAHGTSGAAGPLPHLGEIQRSFGRHDVTGVQAHTDDRAAAGSRAMGAEAFATGDRVAFAGAPSLHTAAHEAAHVLQQQAGVQLRGGVGQVGDRYEQHADHVADAVVRGESSEALLDQVHGGSAGGAVQRSEIQLRAVQLDVRGSVDQARSGRGVDTPQGGGGGAHASFQDEAPGDTGPVLHHDHGFLDDGHGNIDDSLRQDPTWADRLERMKWIAKLEAAELLRPDLVDGTAAYRHFLFGNGAERDVQYGRFLANDSSGRTVLQSAMEDTRQAALERHDRDVAAATPTEGTSSYQIRTGAISVGNDGRYPYPATENWQKALGAHSIWIEANVTVTVTRLRDAGSEPLPGGVPDPGTGSSTESGPPTFSRHFHVEMTIHEEDMYNFNPGNADIATGTPDSANGRFEITGLGHEYMNRGTYSQPFDFDANMAPVASPTSTASPSDPGRGSRTGRPADRRSYPTTR
jgi:hypothetical protein